MIHIIHGDITKLRNVDVIVSASNAMGICGAGVAGAIAKAAGREEIEKQFKGTDLNPGDLLVTHSGRLKYQGIKSIFHAIVMKSPGGPTNYKIIEDCLHKLHKNMNHVYSSIAIPGLGTGIGKLDLYNVALLTISNIAKLKWAPIEYKDARIYLIDTNINYVNHLYELAQEYNLCPIGILSLKDI